MAPGNQPCKANQNQQSNTGEHDRDGGSTPSIQDAETLDIVGLAMQSMQSTTKRRENRRQKIRLDYTNAMDRLQNDIRTAFDSESQRVSKTYKTRAQKLAAVLKRRTVIEEKIAASIGQLDKAHIQFARVLQLTAAGRIRVAVGQDGAAASPAVAEPPIHPTLHESFKA